MKSSDHFELDKRYCAQNYGPMSVVIAEAEGAWVTDVEGKKYIDFLSGYGAINFGHRNQRLINRAKAQLDKVTLTSRAFYNDQLALLCQEISELCGMHSALFMNSGAEAVETALKAARKWGYEQKKVEQDKAEIITFSGNFHGRTTTIISFSDAKKYRAGFGPFTPGFKIVPYGDINAVKAAISKNTVGILVEPIQGEAGVIIPPAGFLRQLRELCDETNTLFLADEVQSGLCRTGHIFYCDSENVKPDLYILGKGLGGGIVPISCIVGREKVMSVFTPGTHGSTFGGNPFACAIAREVILLIKQEKPHERVRQLAPEFEKRVKAIKSSIITQSRIAGLWAGIDIDPKFGSAHDYAEKLILEGVLTKDTRDQTIRIAPPLMISKEDLEWGVGKMEKVFGI